MGFGVQGLRTYEDLIWFCDGDSIYCCCRCSISLMKTADILGATLGMIFEKGNGAWAENTHESHRRPK